jgi:hypothetical protein
MGTPKGTVRRTGVRPGVLPQRSDRPTRCCFRRLGSVCLRKRSLLRWKRWNPRHRLLQPLSRRGVPRHTRCAAPARCLRPARETLAIKAKAELASRCRRNARNERATELSGTFATGVTTGLVRRRKRRGWRRPPPVLASACYGRRPVTGAVRKPLGAWTGDDRRAPLGRRKARAVLIERRIRSFGDEVEIAGRFLEGADLDTGRRKARRCDRHCARRRAQLLAPKRRSRRNLRRLAGQDALSLGTPSVCSLPGSGQLVTDVSMPRFRR